jgi:hypothetical protein
MPDYGWAFSICTEKRASWLLAETSPRRGIGGEKKMGVSKPQAPRPRSAGNQVGIPELYRQCLAAEQNLTKQDLDKLKLIFARGLFFGRPLFEPPPTVDESSAMKKETDLKIRRQLWVASKYRDILDLVRTRTKREDRLFLLAWWLSQEKVCKPEDIVGIEVLRRLAKKTFRCLSFSDFHHADRVRNCLPYFEKLLTDFGTHKGAGPELVKLGYDEAAIRAARRKRSAIPAACEWLANRCDSVSNVDALTLQNAYSRVYGPKRRSVHKSHTFH